MASEVVDLVSSDEDTSDHETRVAKSGKGKKRRGYEWADPSEDEEEDPLFRHRKKGRYAPPTVSYSASTSSTVGLTASRLSSPSTADSSLHEDSFDNAPGSASTPPRIGTARRAPQDADSHASAGSLKDAFVVENDDRDHAADTTDTTDATDMDGEDGEDGEDNGEQSHPEDLDDADGTLLGAAATLPARRTVRKRTMSFRGVTRQGPAGCRAFFRRAPSLPATLLGTFDTAAAAARAHDAAARAELGAAASVNFGVGGALLPAARRMAAHGTTPASPQGYCPPAFNLLPPKRGRAYCDGWVLRLAGGSVVPIPRDDHRVLERIWRFLKEDGWTYRAGGQSLGLPSLASWVYIRPDTPADGPFILNRNVFDDAYFLLQTIDLEAYYLRFITRDGASQGELEAGEKILRQEQEQEAKGPGAEKNAWSYFAGAPDLSARGTGGGLPRTLRKTAQSARGVHGVWIKGQAPGMGMDVSFRAQDLGNGGWKEVLVGLLSLRLKLQKQRVAWTLCVAVAERRKELSATLDPDDASPIEKDEVMRQLSLLTPCAAKGSLSGIREDLVALLRRSGGPSFWAYEDPESLDGAPALSRAAFFAIHKLLAAPDCSDLVARFLLEGSSPPSGVRGDPKDDVSEKSDDSIGAESRSEQARSAGMKASEKRKASAKHIQRLVAELAEERRLREARDEEFGDFETQRAELKAKEAEIDARAAQYKKEEQSLKRQREAFVTEWSRFEGQKVKQDDKVRRWDAEAQLNAHWRKETKRLASDLKSAMLENEKLAWELHSRPVESGGRGGAVATARVVDAIRRDFGTDTVTLRNLSWSGSIVAQLTISVLQEILMKKPETTRWQRLRFQLAGKAAKDFNDEGAGVKEFFRLYFRELRKFSLFEAMGGAGPGSDALLFEADATAPGRLLPPDEALARVFAVLAEEASPRKADETETELAWHCTLCRTWMSQSHKKCTYCMIVKKDASRLYVDEEENGGESPGMAEHVANASKPNAVGYVAAAYTPTAFDVSPPFPGMDHLEKMSSGCRSLAMTLRGFGAILSICVIHRVPLPRDLCHPYLLCRLLGLPPTTFSAAQAQDALAELGYPAAVIASLPEPVEFLETKVVQERRFAFREMLFGFRGPRGGTLKELCAHLAPDGPGYAALMGDFYREEVTGPEVAAVLSKANSPATPTENAARTSDTDFDLLVDVVRDFGAVEAAQFLEFCTGWSTFLDADSFRITVCCKKPHESDAFNLPSSSVCYNTLYLPDAQWNKEVLRERLVNVISHEQPVFDA